MVVKVNGKDVLFDEIIDTFDEHGPYCKEVEVLGTDDDGVEYSAIGIWEYDECTSVEEDTIEVLGKWL